MQKFVFLLCCMDASHALNTSPTSVMLYHCFLPTGGLLIHLPLSIFWWAHVCHFDEVYHISVFVYGYCFLCPVLEAFAYAPVLGFLHLSGFNWSAPLSPLPGQLFWAAHSWAPLLTTRLLSALQPGDVSIKAASGHSDSLFRVPSGLIPAQKFWDDKTKETLSQDPGLPRFSLRSGEKLREWHSQPPACWFPWMVLFFPFICIHRSLSWCLRWLCFPL